MSRINKLIWFLIIGLRPLFGSIQCRYMVTCTEFAKQQLEELSLIAALCNIAKRFLSCNPFL